MKIKPILIILIAAVVLVIGAAVIVVSLTFQQPKEKPVTYIEYALDEAYSNLADANSRKIVKYTVIIQYTDEKMLDSIVSNKTKLMNNIDEIIRTTQSADVEKSNGKERLRMKILDMVIDVLDSDDSVITDIFIQPFIVQG